MGPPEVSWQAVKKSNSRSRTMSENVSLNRTKIILNRKNAIVHSKSRKLFLTERFRVDLSPLLASQISSDAKLIIICMLISGWSVYCVALEKQNKRKQAQGSKWITKALANALANALAKTDQLVDSSLSTHGQRVWWFAYLWAVLYAP